MAQIRRADATWNGNLNDGNGVVSASTSGAFTSLPVTWSARIESSEGKTSPEELMAAAHAACFSMAFSGDLNRNGTPPDQLNVSAEVTFDKLDKWTVTTSKLTVRGRVPGIDAAKFREIAEGARDNCPISRALKGNVELSVDATLDWSAPRHRPAGSSLTLRHRGRRAPASADRGVTPERDSTRRRSGCQARLIAGAIALATCRPRVPGDSPHPIAAALQRCSRDQACSERHRSVTTRLRRGASCRLERYGVRLDEQPSRNPRIASTSCQRGK